MGTTKGSKGARVGFGRYHKDETPWLEGWTLDQGMGMTTRMKPHGRKGRTLDQGMGMAGRTDARSGEGWELS